MDTCDRLQIGASSPAYSEVSDGRDDLTPDDFERRDPVHMRDDPQDRLDSHAGEPAQLPDEFAHFGAIFAHVEGKCAGFLNRVVIAALSLAMSAQDLQLLQDLRAGLQVTGIGVASDEAQGPLLATPSD